MLIDPKLSNLSRDEVIDPNYAKFRCKQAKVISIYSVTADPTYAICEKNQFTQGVSLKERSFKYVVGQQVDVPNYDNNIDNICSAGIHFFLTEKAAYYWANTSTNSVWHHNGRIKICHIDNPITNITTFEQFYYNGTLQKQFSYKDGCTVSKYKCIYTKRCYIKRSGIRHGPQLTFYNDGQIKTRISYNNNNKHGLYKEFHPNGQVKKSVVYVNDLLEGPCKRWYPNGQLSNECHYTNNIVDGPDKHWSESGQLICEINWLNGVHNGLTRRWYPNGKLRVKYTNTNNKINGFYNEWDSDGNLIQKILYTDSVISKIILTDYSSD